MFGKKLVTICFLVTLFSTTFQLTCHGAIFSVSDVAGFRQALIDASNNTEDDTINVATGIYDIKNNGGALFYYLGSTGFGSDNHALTIQGAGAGSTILDGGTTDSIFLFWTGGISDDSTANITIRGITFQNAYQALHISVGNATSTATPDILLENSEFLNNTGWSFAGAALYVTAADGDVTVNNNTFTNNTSSRDAGGLNVSIYYDGSATVTGNTFTSNSAGQMAGGAYVHSGNGNVTLDNNIFHQNTAGEYYGGGTFSQSHNGTVTLSNNIFTENSFTDTWGGGGGVCARSDNGSVVLEKNFFNGNSSGYLGGGAYAFSGSSGNVTLNDNMFEDNSAVEGGGVYARSGSGDVLLTNNILHINDATTGGGVYASVYSNANPADTAEVILTNNTIISNSATDGGGAIVLPHYDGNAAALIYNNIIWGNTATGNGADLYILDDFATFGIPNAGTPVTVSNNNFSGYYGYCESTAGCTPDVTKSNNIDANPNLTDLTEDGTTPEYDYHLQTGSPCINAGSPGALGLPVLDFDDEPRTMGPLPDIGADEYFFPTTIYYCDDDEDTFMDADPDGTCDTAGCEPVDCTIIPGNDCDDENDQINPDESEICDGLDNDCDDTADEDFTDLGNACSVGIGECSTTGNLVCTANGTGTECDATPGSTTSELCDGLDNDCDGSADEDFTNLSDPCSVGIGECSTTGNLVCTADETGTECDATPGSTTSELCDGLDNDCDGSMDEDFPSLGGTCTAGVGECFAAGNFVCTADENETECDAIPGSPATELCDGLDNDCDGSMDEDFPSLGGTCTAGIGECFAAGIFICTADENGTECDAVPGSPTTELCDGLDNDCDGTTDEGCGAGQITVWHTETVDAEGLTGGYTSLAMHSGYPHIGYFDWTINRLKYARFDGTNWQIEINDEVAGGTYLAMVLDSNGNPHISCTSGFMLKYANYNGIAWHAEDVDPGLVAFTSIVLDSEGHPHISYSYAYELRYAFFDGSIWHIETVDIYNVGKFTSIAIDSDGKPHISYYDEENSALKYAFFDGSDWHLETVDSAGWAGAGRYTSIALDKNDHPHISYLEWSNYNLRYAHFDGSVWHTETIDNDGFAGDFTSLALDASDLPHISYRANGHLMYTYNDGSSWVIETVDTSGWVGYTSMKLDTSGNPHIAYQELYEYDLKYAYKTELPVTNSATVSSSGGNIEISITDGNFSSPPILQDPGAGIPDGFVTPFGALSFSIQDVAQFQTVTVVLSYPFIQNGVLFKCNDGSCFEVTGVSYSGDQVVFDITDNGPLDLNSEPGNISDPVVLAFPAVPEIAVDIKPQSCRNPINVKSRGKITAAVLGSPDFDVARIDPSTVRLAGALPLRWAQEDVATPYEPFTGKQDAYDCNDFGPDGHIDLTLKFDTQELVELMVVLLGREPNDGEVLVLPLTGNLLLEHGGAKFTGEDVVVILSKGKKD